MEIWMGIPSNRIWELGLTENGGNIVSHPNWWLFQGIMMIYLVTWTGWVWVNGLMLLSLPWTINRKIDSAFKDQHFGRISSRLQMDCICGHVLFSPIVGMMIQSDSYFWGGVGIPPTRVHVQYFPWCTSGGGSELISNPSEVGIVMDSL